VEKCRSGASIGLSGVEGDSARGKKHQELGRPLAVPVGGNSEPEAITGREAARRRRMGS